MIYFDFRFSHLIYNDPSLKDRKTDTIRHFSVYFANDRREPKSSADWTEADEFYDLASANDSKVGTIKEWRRFYALGRLIRNSDLESFGLTATEGFTILSFRFLCHALTYRSTTLSTIHIISDFMPKHEIILNTALSYLKSLRQATITHKLLLGIACLGMSSTNLGCVDDFRNVLSGDQQRCPFDDVLLWSRECLKKSWSEERECLKKSMAFLQLASSKPYELGSSEKLRESILNQEYEMSPLKTLLRECPLQSTVMQSQLETLVVLSDTGDYKAYDIVALETLVRCAPKLRYLKIQMRAAHPNSFEADYVMTCFSKVALSTCRIESLVIGLGCPNPVNDWPEFKLLMESVPNMRCLTTLTIEFQHGNYKHGNNCRHILILTLTSMLKKWQHDRLLHFCIPDYRFWVPDFYASLGSKIKKSEDVEVTEWVPNNKSIHLWAMDGGNIFASHECRAIGQATHLIQVCIYLLFVLFSKFFLQVSLIHWEYVSVLLAFLRANHGHPFQYSIFPLLKLIRQYSAPVDFYAQVGFKEPSVFRMDSFSQSKYAQNVIKDTIILNNGNGVTSNLEKKSNTKKKKRKNR